jgi:hypothetical protein
MKMKFVVKLDYHKFEFDDADCAITFAGIAKKNYIKDDDEDIKVTIFIEKEEEKNGMEF